MIKTVIVDSNQEAIDNLKLTLEAFDLIDVVAEEKNFFAGIKAINKHRPQLVFLEVDLAEYSGFKLLECFEEDAFRAVFVTNRTTEALRAFRSSVSGYIVKPVSLDKIQHTLNGLIPEILLTSRDERKHSGRLIFPAPSGYHYVSNSEILYLSSEGKHSSIHKIDGTVLDVPKNLKSCQLLLDSIFVRVHRSFVVNLQFIKHYSKGNDVHVIMENGTRVDVGRQYKEKLDELLQYILK